MNYYKIILEKYRKKELTKYLFWKLGLQKFLENNFLQIQLDTSNFYTIRINCLALKTMMKTF